MNLVITLLYIVFVLSAIVLVVVILLQEGRGGGLSDALGTGGQQAFGVAASGIHKFTGLVAGVFLVSALGIHFSNRQFISGSVVQPGESSLFDNLPPPADGGGAGEGGGQPAGDGEQPR